jgi:hypothetical protein
LDQNKARIDAAKWIANHPDATLEHLPQAVFCHEFINTAQPEDWSFSGACELGVWSFFLNRPAGLIQIIL